jgi:hypothetical protein
MLESGQTPRKQHAMQPFAYSNSPWSIRPDIEESFRYTWDKLSHAGTWLTGAERVQIAREVRHAQSCELCRARKAALSPFGAQGEHDGDHAALNPMLVDVTHRLTTDASRLTKTWLDSLVEDGVSLEAYVEVLSVVVSTIAIDSFHDALGFPLEPLPDSVAGAPSEYRPNGAKDHGAWVPTVVPADVDPDDADIYNHMRRTGNVITAMSLVPDAVRLLRNQSAAMYLEVTDIANPAANGGRALSRPQIELIAGRVSALNDCFY